jgi:hypothetical protein
LVPPGGPSLAVVLMGGDLFGDVLGVVADPAE